MQVPAEGAVVLFPLTSLSTVTEAVGPDDTGVHKAFERVEKAVEQAFSIFEFFSFPVPSLAVFYILRHRYFFLFEGI
jgi:hypothetical protein